MSKLFNVFAVTLALIGCDEAVVPPSGVVNDIATLAVTIATEDAGGFADAGPSYESRLASIEHVCGDVHESVVRLDARVAANIEFVAVEVHLFESGAEACARLNMPAIAMTTATTYSVVAPPVFLGFSVPSPSARVMPQRGCAPGYDYALVPDGSFARSRDSEGPAPTGNYCLSEPVYRSAICARVPSFGQAPVLHRRSAPPPLW